MTSSFVAINHVGLSVADLGRAQRFWCEGLGALDHGGWSWPVGTAPADDSLDTADTAASVALLRTETAFLELFAFTAPQPMHRTSRAPGVRSLTWAVTGVEAAVERALAAGGTPLSTPQGPAVRCPDGTPIEVVEVGTGGEGLVGVRLAVPDPAAFVLPSIPGPVALAVEGGADEPVARPIDLGVNHVCLDVEGIAEVRAGLDGVRWHHEITESSGGIAAVSYGTTADGVLIELLESRSPEAFLSRCRLARG